MDRGSVGSQPRTQDRVLQVRLRFDERADRIALRYLAQALAGGLWQDELHPMAALVPRGQLLEGLVVAAALSINEAVEVERVTHPEETPGRTIGSRQYFCDLWLVVNRKW